MIHPTAVVEDSDIDSSAEIGAHCYIAHATIGKRTIVFPNTSIGTDGMIFKREEDGSLGECKPHTGRVIIGDDVWIGQNTAINRGRDGDTIIGDDTKIGHLCSIGHDVKIGKHCIIVTGTLIGGLVAIGDHARVSLGARVRDRITIGEKASVGMGAVVTKSVEPLKCVWGVPAREHELRSSPWTQT